MRYFKFILLILPAFLLLKACKKDTAEETEPPASTGLETVVQLMDTVQGYYIYQIQSNGGQSYPALVATFNWLQTQPQVDVVDLMDPGLILITLKSGLSTYFMIDYKNSSGKSIFRGGGTTDGLTQLTGYGPCTNPVANKNVLMYVAMHKEFYDPGELQQVLNRFNNSVTPLNVTVLIDSQCTPQIVNTFGNYGLVIIDTHGKPDGFLTGIRVNFDSVPRTNAAISAVIEAQVGTGTYQRFLKDEWSIGRKVSIDTTLPNWYFPISKSSSYSVTVRSRYLNTLGSWDQTIVFGNMCYSGFGGNHFSVKEPIRTAMMNRNPISYYCYKNPTTDFAYAVQDLFAKKMEDSLITSLVIQADSTGIAHLQPNGQTYNDSYVCMLNGATNRCNDFFQFGHPDYCFGCGETFTDPRDGEVYPIVCIGDQVWMARNLNYAAPGSDYFNNDPANGPILGRLYSWNTLMNGQPPSSTVPSGIQGLCPNGWHIPSNQEVVKLANFLGGNAVAGGLLKDTLYWSSPNVGATNATGFSGRGGGLDNVVNGFGGFGTEAYFWTTSSGGVTAQYALAFTLQSNAAGLGQGTIYQKTMRMSCRCVKD